jgi:hypothetical protein
MSKEKIIEIFDAHPKLDCYFKTSDGSCFYTENAAETHAKTLENKNVKTIVRESKAVESKEEATSDIAGNTLEVAESTSKEVAENKNKK